MLAERWRRIEALFHEALEKTAEERASFLNHACAGDHSLRREIQSLLQHESLARSFLESDGSGAPPPDAPRDPIPEGERIGHYTVMEPLGAGGMGEVYKAHDQRLERHVAIKFLAPQMTGDATSLKRFEREARAASALNHPNICTVHDVGEFGGRPFLVMELLEGQSLKERIAEGPVGAQELVSIARQVCAALQAAHDKGIVHRDIKPANIFLTHGGQVKVLDFGLAKRDVGFAEPAPQADSGGQHVSRTATGAIMGTLAYMSPEQAVGEDVDSRSDIFSLGVVLFEMAAGRPPFRGKTAAGLLGSILTEAPAKPSAVHPGSPVKLDRIVLRALGKNAASRYDTAAALSADLDRCLNSARGRRVAWMVAGIAAVTIAVFAAAASRLGWFPIESRPDLTPRQVTANPPEDPIMVASLSPDGETVAYGDFAGIHLRRIETGESTLIPPPAADYCFR